jgi:GWxTD domain-containing protein
MKTIHTCLAAAIVATLSVTAFAAVSPAKRSWADGPVQFLMTKEEAAAWLSLDSDAAADDFIALFWARRDPTPDTPRNEFREDFQARLKFADEQFTVGSRKGSMSDRGKLVILFGPPLRALNIKPELRGKTSDATHDPDQQVQRQVWVYESPASRKVFSLPHAEITFIDRVGDGDYRLLVGSVDLHSAEVRAIAQNITQPDLTKAPVFEAPKAASPVATQAAAPVEGIHTAALQAAVDAAKGAPPSAAQVSYAEFVAPTGDYFVPIALTVPKSANLAPGAVDTFFGEIRDANGTKVTSFEEKAKPIEAKSSWFVDKTLDLPTGKYTAVFGVANAGQPLLMGSTPIETTVLAKDAVGVAKLILWTDILTLPEAAPVKSPYAFGRYQIVPNATRTFGNKDELGYFLEINNPGVDITTNAPKLQTSIELQLDGKPISRAPLSEAQAVPLSGALGPGHYAIISSIQLSRMATPLAAGDYTMKMKILDTVTKQSYTVQESFKIAP